MDAEESFLAAFKNHSWHAVISDYVLPQFSGPEALRLYREQGFEIPFIMVSGLRGEEATVAIAPALDREIEAATNRRLHQRAIGTTQFLAAIVESSEDAIYGKNLASLIAS